MTTSLTQSQQLDAIAQDYTVPCPVPHPFDSEGPTIIILAANCTRCHGTGTIHPYRSIGDWLEAHHKDVLYKYVLNPFPMYLVVLPAGDALDLLEECTGIHYGRIAGLWHADLNVTASTPDALLALVLEQLQQEEATKSGRNITDMNRYPG